MLEKISLAYFEVAETKEKEHVKTRAKAIKDTNTFITCVACMRFRHEQKKTHLHNIHNEKRQERAKREREWAEE